MNMFAMGHGLHSAVRQEVRKFLYNNNYYILASILAMPFKRGTVPPYYGDVSHYWVKPHPLYPPFLVDFQ